jgi:hypothetical protein
MAALQTVLELVERFDRNRTTSNSDQYNETRLRIEFLNPFLKHLYGIPVIGMDMIKAIEK